MLFIPSAANGAAASLTFSGLAAFTMLALLGHHRVGPHLISPQPAAAPAPEPAPVDYCANVTDAPVAWNADSNRCVPDVCHDSRLEDLADVSGEVAASVICKTKLFDSAAARSCLANKHLLLLGDSTTGETAHDLVILLSGIAANRTLLTDYMRRVRLAVCIHGHQPSCVPYVSMMAQFNRNIANRAGDEGEGQGDDAAAAAGLRRRQVDGRHRVLRVAPPHAHPGAGVEHHRPLPVHRWGLLRVLIVFVFVSLWRMPCLTINRPLTGGACRCRALRRPAKCAQAPCIRRDRLVAH